MSFRDATDSSSLAFSILSERAFTPRITGRLHRVLSTSVNQFRASQRDERHCCLVRPCETRERIPNNTLGSVLNVAVRVLVAFLATGEARHSNVVSALLRDVVRLAAFSALANGVPCRFCSVVAALCPTCRARSRPVSVRPVSVRPATASVARRSFRRPPLTIGRSVFPRSCSWSLLPFR